MRQYLMIAAFLAVCVPAAAAEKALVSAYTDVDLDQCEMTDSDIISAVFACEGLGGMPVTIIESDLRMTVSYGENPMDEPSIRQGFSPFNRLGAKMEWLSPADTPDQPVATILRWYLQRGEGPDESQILVVTQLVPGATCQIAWIDATANKDANVLARQAATELAGDFDCDGMPRIYGAFEAFELE
jgi:hypothetical protein